MDQTDLQIISVLQRDGRASHAAIARELGVSEGTVRRRLQALLQDQVVRVVGVPDPQSLGYKVQALIGLRVDPDRVQRVLNAVAELDEARWVTATTGEYDVFLWVVLPSPGDLDGFLRSKIGTISGIYRSETFVSMRMPKRASGLSARLLGAEEPRATAKSGNGRRRRRREQA